ncbi:MAG: RNA polymerase factor sigma-54 [Candidatus Eisenbacteria bacterium]|nr:RNA polymerase factor sigma-54 [Candidatus Latescibacterota bacterium]MBD3302587.1 RNA polymerase factor sigma-54 [Candidatus Eisenbacteria bacterium]
MEMRPGLRMQQRQQLAITQKVQLMLKFLQIPTLELQQVLHQEILTNPVLELEEEDPITDEAPKDAEAKPETSSQDDYAEQAKSEEEPQEPDWSELYHEEYDRSFSGGEREEGEFKERVPVAGTTMGESVLEQLRLLVHGKEEEELAEYLVGMLDERGYLTGSDEEIAEQTGAPIETVASVVEKLQSCDPPGIGARSLRECLLLQLRAKGLEGSVAWQVIDRQWDNLTKRRHAEIARELKVGLDRIQDATDQIGSLLPHPGRLISTEDVRYIYPDLIVEEVDGSYEVYLNDRSIPRLRVSPAYGEALLGGGGDNKTKDYIKSRLNSARWLIQAIEKRRRTMVRVMEAIIDEQREYFEKGVSHLKPMTLQDIATRVGIHESTVARVTKAKYVQTPRGVFPMKHFFSSRLHTDTGEDASAKAVKERIRELIDGEPKESPLSDEKIAKVLQREGIQIARRTVAKYRDQMKIDKAQFRKRISRRAAGGE